MNYIEKLAIQAGARIEEDAKGNKYTYLEDMDLDIFAELLGSRSENLQTTITRKFLKKLKFTVMDENDIVGFAGCASPVPLLAETEDGLLVVLDGDYCEVYDGETMEMVDSRDGISELLTK
jgi:hypothetical protein